MLRYLPVRKVHARQVLDSRGNPTVEAEVTVGEGIIGINGFTGRAMVPSGASTGKFEAVELRDGNREEYLGQSVKKAVENINTRLADAIIGENALNQAWIDHLLIETDGTENKSSAGANATLAVSLATARAAAGALRLPLYQYLGGCHTMQLPVPMMNILNGGKHADNTVDLQEFMIMPTGAGCLEKGIRMCAEVYQHLKLLLREKGLSTAVGDEGGFAPDLPDSEEVLTLIVHAVEKAGYKPGEEITIAIDAASSELYDEEKGVYFFPGESRMKGEKIYRDAREMTEYYEKLVGKFPIVSIEDGLWEDDWEGWQMMTKELGDKVQLVGDDLFVTNPSILYEGIEKGIANAILIKVNQIGTLTETFDAIEMAKKHGYTCIVSHRSGETEDTTIADIAVGLNAGQIKTGSLSRTDRIAKYNRLMRIEDELNQRGTVNVAEYLGDKTFYNLPAVEFKK